MSELCRYAANSAFKAVFVLQLLMHFFLFCYRHMLQMTGKFGYYLGLDRLDELGVIYVVFCSVYLYVGTLYLLPFWLCCDKIYILIVFRGPCCRLLFV